MAAVMVWWRSTVADGMVTVWRRRVVDVMGSLSTMADGMAVAAAKRRESVAVVVEAAAVRRVGKVEVGVYESPQILTLTNFI